MGQTGSGITAMGKLRGPVRASQNGQWINAMVKLAAVSNAAGHG